MQLNELKFQANSRHNTKRKGRGIGSGKGKTCGHGHKGQNARSGGGVRVGFEGGQTPVYLRLPKIGFTCRSALYRQTLCLDAFDRSLARFIAAGTLEKGYVIDIKVLQFLGMIRKNTKSVKIVNGRDVKDLGSYIIKGISASSQAKGLIEKAGGRVDG